MRKRTSKTIEEMAVVHPNAAGLDISASEIWACVPADRDGERIKVFGTFTPDLQRLADWLIGHEVDTVAMESTAVYWVPIFELLEARGIQACLVNARHIKTVPGRKSDYLDCQWLQKLHMLGMLSASFRPDAEMVRLRGYLRHRAQLIQHRAPHLLHMHQALHQMNIQLGQVLTDIGGTTGFAIIRAIVAGERDGLQLAKFRDPRCKSSEATIAKALTGDWKPEQLFVLHQSLELYDCYTQQLLTCDAHIEAQFAAMRPRFEPATPLPDLPPAKPNTRSKNQPPPSTRAQLIRLIGVDLVAIKGISASLAQTILSEIGTDMSRWPTDKHFASWLGLAPHNDISGGKVLRSRTLSTTNRAGQAFRQAAVSVSRTRTAFGAFYRRKCAQLGPAQALVATAHKIARAVYHLLKYHVPFEEIGAANYELKQRERELASLRKRAAQFGFTLSEIPAQPST